MVDVVISYSREDQALVDPIAEQLRTLGLDVCCDPKRDSQSTDAEAIEKQIDGCGALLVCWSDDARASRWVRAQANAGFEQGKLVAARLAPCRIPAPFDAMEAEDLQSWAGRIESPEWEKIVAAIAEKLHRPGVTELLKARISVDDGALYAFARRFCDEPQARQIWAAREAEYREEFAGTVRDARRFLQQRVTDQQTKIENALTTLDSDFEAWLERERRGETSPKPSLSTLFDIWLERGCGGKTPPKTDEYERRASTAEARALELQKLLERESARTAELGPLEAAAKAARDRAEQAEADLAKARAEFEALKAAPGNDDSKRRIRRRRLVVGGAVAVIATIGVGLLAGPSFQFGQKPLPTRAASVVSSNAAHSALSRTGSDARTALARLLEAAPADVVRASASKAPALAVGEALRASLSQAMVPVAKLPAQDLARELLAHMSPGEVTQLTRQFLATSPNLSSAKSTDAINAALNGPRRQEIVSLVTKAAPVEALEEMLANQKDELDRQALLARLIQLAPEEVARALASKAPDLAVGEALKASTPQAIVKALEANVSAPKMLELGKLFHASLAASPPQHIANYRTYDNRDIESGDISKVKNVDLQNCVSACRQKESCKAYTFDKWNRACYLKSKIGGFKLNPRSWTGVRDNVRVPKAPSGEITMERYPLKAFPGSGYKAVKAEAADACEHICRTEEACVAYTFHIGERTCRLFESTGEYFGDNLADSGGKRRD